MGEKSSGVTVVLLLHNRPEAQLDDRCLQMWHICQNLTQWPFLKGPHGLISFLNSQLAKCQQTSRTVPRSLRLSGLRGNPFALLCGMNQKKKKRGRWSSEAQWAKVFRVMERGSKRTRGCLWSSVKPEQCQRTKGGPASRIFICGRKQQVYRRHIIHIMQ